MKYPISFHNTQIKSITFTYTPVLYKEKTKYMCLLYSPKNST